MRNPAEILGDRLSGASSRRGFFATLGKLALLGGAALAALSGENAYATCGAYDCVWNNHDYGYSCPDGSSGTFSGCCHFGTQYYATYCCGSQCCYSFATSPGCPRGPVP